MVTKKEILALGILGAASFALFRKPFNSISENRISQTLSFSRPTISLSDPLPFKTTEQQRKEFIPTFTSETRVSPTLRKGSLAEKTVIEQFQKKGFEISRDVPFLSSRKNVRGAETNFHILEFTKKTQTNVFKPSLTSI